MLLPIQSSETPKNDNMNGGHVTYILDRGLLKFAKFVGAALAIFLVIGTYFFGFKLEKAVDELREGEQSLNELQGRLETAQIELDQAINKVRSLDTELESTLAQAKMHLGQINEQNKLALAIVVSMKELTPAQKFQLDELTKGPNSLVRKDTKGSLWTNGATIRVSFLGGSDAQQKKVVEIAAEWSEFANLTFGFNDDASSEIRIAFEPSLGNWTFIGTQSLAVKPSNATMNLGFVSDGDTITEEDRGNVLHEFGHVLGMIHEFQNPNSDIRWNKDVVYASLSYLDRSTVERNYFRKHDKDKLPDYREFDPESVMNFDIDPSFLIEGPLIRRGTSLSESDKAFAAALYPK